MSISQVDFQAHSNKNSHLQRIRSPSVSRTPSPPLCAPYLMSSPNISQHSLPNVVSLMSNVTFCHSDVVFFLKNMKTLYNFKHIFFSLKYLQISCKLMIWSYLEWKITHQLLNSMKKNQMKYCRKKL